MGGLHDDEASHFVDGLTPLQRVFLQRLLGETLAAFPPDEAPADGAGSLQHESVQPLFHLLELLRTYAPADSGSDIRPFALSVPEPGHARLLVSRRILSWPGLWEPRSTDWMAHLRAGRLTVDVSPLDELNSSTIAWLLNLAQHLPDRRLRLVGARPHVRRSLAVLGVGHILVQDDAAAGDLAPPPGTK